MYMSFFTSLFQPMDNFILQLPNELNKNELPELHKKMVGKKKKDFCEIPQYFPINN